MKGFKYCSCFSVNILVALLVLCFLTSCGRPESGLFEDALQKGDLAKVKAFLTENPALITHRAQDSDPDTPDFGGWTPLHFAAANGHKDIVEFLIASKVDINSVSDHCETPLSLAAKNGQDELWSYCWQIMLK